MAAREEAVPRSRFAALDAAHAHELGALLAAYTQGLPPLLASRDPAAEAAFLLAPLARDGVARPEAVGAVLRRLMAVA